MKINGCLKTMNICILGRILAQVYSYVIEQLSFILQKILAFERM